jgi:hypothetical protein
MLRADPHEGDMDARVKIRVLDSRQVEFRPKARGIAIVALGSIAAAANRYTSGIPPRQGKSGRSTRGPG